MWILLIPGFRKNTIQYRNHAKTIKWLKFYGNYEYSAAMLNFRKISPKAKKTLYMSQCKVMSNSSRLIIDETLLSRVG